MTMTTSTVEASNNLMMRYLRACSEIEAALAPRHSYESAWAAWRRRCSARKWYRQAHLLSGSLRVWDGGLLTRHINPTPRPR